MSLAGLYTGATWPSFQTGVNPARSGVYSWMQLKPGSYEQYRCLAGDQLKREPFWTHLSRAGRNVTVLDIPLSGLTENLNGVQSVEWGAHDAQYGFLTWPPSARAARSRPIRTPPACAKSATPIATPRLHRVPRSVAARHQHQNTAHKAHSSPRRLEFLRSGLQREPLRGPPVLAYTRPSHPRHDPAQARAVGDPLKDVYVAIDAAIGEVLEEIDDDTTVIVLASHGMGYKYGPQILLDHILLALTSRRRPGMISVPRSGGRDCATISIRC